MNMNKTIVLPEQKPVKIKPPSNEVRSIERTPQRGTSVGVRGFSGETTKEFRRMNSISLDEPCSPSAKQNEYFSTSEIENNSGITLVDLSSKVSSYRNTSTEKEKQKRVVTNTKRWRFTEEDYTKENQLALLKSIQHMEPGISTDSQISVLQQLNQKVAGYKSQDISKDKYNPILFVTRERVIELLIKSQLKCHYCKNDVKVLYEIVREPLQWTLDRIDNDYGHNTGNLFVACLSCNLRRRTIYHERYVMTKICTNVIKLS